MVGDDLLVDAHGHSIFIHLMIPFVHIWCRGNLHPSTMPLAAMVLPYVALLTKTEAFLW